MTPERIAELKEQAVIKSFVPVESWELLDLLATAEREAKLRKNIQTIATICDPDAAKLLRSALEKGGEQ